MMWHAKPGILRDKGLSDSLFFIGGNMEKEVLDRYEEIKERHKTRMDYGVKGMKWGDHKSEASNGGTDLSDVYSRIEKDQEEAKKRGISLGEYYRSTDFIKK